MASAEQIVKRFKKAKNRKNNWEELYRDAIQHTRDERDSFHTHTPGENRDASQIIFDSTAQDALLTGVSNLHTSLTPSMKRWIELKPGPALAGDQQLEKALEAITEQMFSHLHNSNFDTQIVESYTDVFYGTGALLAFKGTAEQPFNFVNVPLSQLVIEEGPNHRIDTAFREFEISARNITRQWEDAKLTPELIECIKEDPDKKISLIEATMPEKVTIFNPATNRDEEVDGFKYCVVSKGEDVKLVERSMRTSPWIIFRWSTMPGEIYGRGPVLTALPSIKTLNEQVKILLQAASIATVGMYTVADDGVVNVENIRLESGALIPVTSNGSQVQGPTLAPLPTAGNPNLAELVIQDQQSQIRRMLFSDPLGDVNLPVKTATEISLRQQELAKRIGSAFGKLQYELIGPLVNRLLDILDELGLIELGEFKVDGTNLAIQHISPLAQAQDEEDVIRNVRYVEMIANLYGPQVLQAIVDPFRFAEVTGGRLNIDSRLKPTKEQEETIKQGLQQAAEQGMIAPQDIGG